MLLASDQQGSSHHITGFANVFQNVFFFFFILADGLPSEQGKEVRPQSKDEGAKLLLETDPLHLSFHLHLIFNVCLPLVLNQHQPRCCCSGLTFSINACVGNGMSLSLGLGPQSWTRTPDSLLSDETCCCCVSIKDLFLFPDDAAVTRGSVDLCIPSLHVPVSQDTKTKTHASLQNHGAG